MSYNRWQIGIPYCFPFLPLFTNCILSFKSDLTFWVLFQNASIIFLCSLHDPVVSRFSFSHQPRPPLLTMSPTDKPSPLPVTQDTREKQKKSQTHRCVYCGNEYKRSQELRRHILQHRSDLPPSSCPLCGKKYLRRSDMLVHVRVAHEGLRKYCDLCEFSAGYRSEVNRHRRTQHLGERFPCSLCGKEFVSAQNLAQHRDNTHIQIKHDCAICAKKLSSKISLYRHTLIHKYN